MVPRELVRMGESDASVGFICVAGDFLIHINDLCGRLSLSWTHIPRHPAVILVKPVSIALPQVAISSSPSYYSTGRAARAACATLDASERSRRMLLIAAPRLHHVCIRFASQTTQFLMLTKYPRNESFPRHRVRERPFVHGRVDA